MALTQPATSSKATLFQGSARIPGDKSISHRALMLAALAKGESIISGLLESDDVLCTAAAMRSLGASVYNESIGHWRINGIDNNFFLEPSQIVDLGNSGTSARLIMGLIAGHPISVTFTGDNSLINRPMNRVIRPLTEMGAMVLSRDGGRMPLTLKGHAPLQAIQYAPPIASAQVKSAILLAALKASGPTQITETKATRDHTERMLEHFGVKISTTQNRKGAYTVTLDGNQPLTGCAIDIPSDPSSAAFPVVVATLQKGSQIKLSGICVNERRIGLYTTLQEMGAKIEFRNQRVISGEPVADLYLTGTGELRGISVPPDRVPSMIDEFPILAVAASCAQNDTVMSGIAELRVKESDRLKLISKGLTDCGVTLIEGEDSLTIKGVGSPPKGGAYIETAQDHRIAMSFLVLGCLTDEPIEIDDAAAIATSFPGFIDLMNEFGAQIVASDSYSTLHRAL